MKDAEMKGDGGITSHEETQKHTAVCFFTHFRSRWGYVRTRPLKRPFLRNKRCSVMLSFSQVGTYTKEC